MQKVILALVNNEPEVLMRITGFLRRRGFKIKSISMVETSDPSLAHLTIKTEEENQSIERAIYNMEKFINVHVVKKLEGVTYDWNALKTKAKEADMPELLNVINALDQDFLEQAMLKNIAFRNTM